MADNTQRSMSVLILKSFSPVGHGAAAAAAAILDFRKIVKFDNIA